VPLCHVRANNFAAAVCRTATFAFHHQAPSGAVPPHVLLSASLNHTRRPHFTPTNSVKFRCWALFDERRRTPAAVVFLHFWHSLIKLLCWLLAISDGDFSENNRAKKTSKDHS
jgi:hypothetical protein